MYAVTKTALFGLTKALAAELTPKKEEVKLHTLLGRFGKADDMDAAVAFLVSDDVSYITGEVLPVSGGIPSRLLII
ncbi:hypothetical protein GOP47_0015397 [Adiantum capillus-veneris]|uniref:Uncharacterized protein n=1 Tax=Adiantum capillus-veneris TaxID=13818 RepID=A0A9D4UJM3_ADICA|nr:hypothetical protein GOP47_0015397 [Adiantum capillus-veneris]